MTTAASKRKPATRTKAPAVAKAAVPPPAAPADGVTKLDLDLLPTTIGYFLRRLQQSYKAHFLQSTPGLDLAPKAVGALFVVSRNPGLSPRQFGIALGIDGAMTSLMLSSLEQRGLLKREKSAEDGRARVITLTKEGTAMVAKLRRTVKRVDLEFTSSFSEQERAQLLGLMARLWASRAGVLLVEGDDRD